VNNFSAVGQGMELLKEIKDAVAREKESDPDFDNSGLADIDTFFVLEQVVEIQEMFKEIEGELESNWDLYIKALKQYKEREGDCLVPQKHIEILDSGITTSLGNWVQRIRSRKKGKGRILLTSERIKQLEQLDFVWDEKKTSIFK
jgi:Helicase associated domain.